MSQAHFQARWRPRLPGYKVEVYWRHIIPLLHLESWTRLLATIEALTVGNNEVGTPSKGDISKCRPPLNRRNRVWEPFSELAPKTLP